VKSANVILYVNLGENKIYTNI